ncbi:MAG: D-alanyl-D-alanine carboxypeptidase, partial [Novosphingobium sp.]|nr:D-alanyl-D-alanine carboxypeptidase [Novosphingobium sp.]
MLVDLGSGQVLHARQADLSFVPASMTKVMTAYVAFEEIAAGRLSLDHKFTVRPETSDEWKGKGTSMYLDPGEIVSADDLLRGIMTASANDASVVLAEGFATSVPAWSFLMNDTARRLGLQGSRFNTPNGWPDEGKTYVTARDLVILSDAMLSKYPQLYRRYSGGQNFVWHDRILKSHDPVTGVVPGADGIKTGFTREAGFNFLGSAERDGRRLVMVVAGAKTGGERTKAARAFLEWGFSEWKVRRLFHKGDPIGTVRVQGGNSRSVKLLADRNIHAAFPRDSNAQIELKIVYNGPIEAPVDEGAAVAQLE